LLYLILLSLGHAVTDLNQGAIPALLPVLRDTYGLTYAMTGAIVMVANLSSSVIQPVFGIASDKITWKWILPLGVFTAGFGMSIISIARTYGLLLAAVALTGVGVASYHPEGSRTAYHLSGERRGTAMSLFSVGGNVGMALGPVLAAFALAFWGLRGIVLFLAVSAFMAALLAPYVPKIYQAERRQVNPQDDSEAPVVRQCWTGVILLVVIVALRSLVQFGVLTYVPFYYVDNLGGDPAHVGRLLLAFLGAGALGTLFGGPLGDIFGRKRVLMASTGLLFPVHLMLLASRGPAIFLVLAVEGLLIVSTFTITLVMAQEYLPNNVGLASGLNIGLQTGIGGIASALLGIMADRLGLPFTLKFLGVLPLAAFAIALALPATNVPLRRASN